MIAIATRAGTASGSMNIATFYRIVGYGEPMLWFLLACTVGPSTTPPPASVTAVDAKQMNETGRTAGRLAGVARELEAAAQTSQSLLASGADPAAEVAKLEQLVAELERLEGELQTEHRERLDRIRDESQSTAATKE